MASDRQRRMYFHEFTLRMNVLVLVTPHGQRCKRVLRTMWNGIWWTTPKRNSFIVCMCVCVRVCDTLWMKPRRICARRHWHYIVHQYIVTAVTTLYWCRCDRVIKWTNKTKISTEIVWCSEWNTFSWFSTVAVHVRTYCFVVKFFLSTILLVLFIIRCVCVPFDTRWATLCTCVVCTYTISCKQQQSKRDKIKRFYSIK